MKYKKFEELPLRQLSLSLTKQIYDYTSQGERSKDFGLRDQIRRASVSITSTIVEGFEKNNNNEFCRFLRMAKGSCGEVRSQLYIAQAIGYINSENCLILQESFDSLAKQIGGLIVYLVNLKKSKINP